MTISSFHEPHLVNIFIFCKKKIENQLPWYLNLGLRWTTIWPNWPIMFLIQEDLTSSSSSLNVLACEKFHLPWTTFGIYFHILYFFLKSTAMIPYWRLSSNDKMEQNLLLVWKGGDKNEFLAGYLDVLDSHFWLGLN